MWLLGLAMICSAFNAYFYYSWFPKYLQDARGLGNVEAGWLASLVLGGSAVGMLAGGLVADRVSRLRSVVWGRRLLGGCAYLMAAGFLFAAARSESPTTLAALAAVSAMCTQVVLPTWWSAAIEQSGRHVGALFGLLNMMGTLGALSSQWFVGAFADWRKGLGYTGREQWDPMFNVYIIVLLIGSMTWLVYRRRPLE
jgi:MFS family permease